MSLHQTLRLLLLAISVFLFVSCSNVPPADFYEVDGLVSAQINELFERPNWVPVHHINSSGLISDITHPDSTASLTFTVHISNPGRYSFWLLSTSAGLDRDSVNFDVSISGPDEFLADQFLLGLPGGDRLTWIQADGSADNQFIPFEKRGIYTISINPRGSDGLQVHKVHLSFQNAVKPFGLGFPSSVRTDLSAAELFGEQPVMLPSAWAFEPVIGTEDTGDLPDSLIEASSFQNYTLGGVWRGKNTEVPDTANSTTGRNAATGLKLEAKDICNEKADAVFGSGFQFIFTFDSPGLECLESVNESYRRYAGSDQRGVLFHGLMNRYDPASKLYPAPVTPFYQFKWSSETTVRDGRFQPGGYQEMVSDLTNPTNSLYNMPFLSFLMDFSSALDPIAEWDSELFIRTIQLSAFLPVMHIVEPKNPTEDNSFFAQLRESERQQFYSALILRTSLFPYHYTHAHYTRQSNKSVIKGFRDHPDQFMYGDAFLAAPVMEKESEGRIVYFPEGRRWYNYYTGETYEAGQSWFVETRLDHMPLFVKAGSIIPYIMDGNQNHFKIEIYAGDAGSFRMVEDDGSTNAYRRAEAARTMFRYNEVQNRQHLTIGAVQAEFDGMANARSYDLHFKFTDFPESVRINNEEIESGSGNEMERSWHYDETEEELILYLRDQSKYEKLDIVIIP